MNIFGSLEEAKSFYKEWGFDTLPLKYGSKIPIPHNWPSRDPDDMWLNAPDNANIGIRCGGRSKIAVLDCDEKTSIGVYENALAWLEGLGFHPENLPTVQTASGAGRHIYLSYIGTFPGSYCKLSSDFGAGELRYGTGSMVVAPPSIVEDSTYVKLTGDFRDLPVLYREDIIPILNSHEPAMVQEFIPSKISRNAWSLLKGRSIDSYPSRSEAEHALIVSLLNTGHDFDSLLALFQKYPCAGKFAELFHKDSSDAIRWLTLSCRKAKEWAETHTSPERRTAEDLAEWALSSSWPGRTGSCDRAVYIAHSTIASQAGQLIYAASARRLAELAGVSHMTASRATNRLLNMGLLTLVTEHKGELSNIYSLSLEERTVTLPPPSLLVRKCNSTLSHDVFRLHGLGKSAFEVWSALQNYGPMTTRRLAECTGRHITTVRKALSRMSSILDIQKGVFVPMVQEVSDSTWIVLVADLDYVATLMNINGKGEQEQKKHIMERRAFKHALGRKPNVLTADDQIFYERGLSIQSSSTLDEVCTNDEL